MKNSASSVSVLLDKMMVTRLLRLLAATLLVSVSFWVFATRTTANAVVQGENFAIYGISEGESVGDEITIETIANSGVNVTNFQYYIDDQFVRRESRAPYCMAGDNRVTCRPYSTTGLSDGNHVLRVDMIAGSITESITVNFSVGGPPAPDFSINGISEGEFVNGNIIIGATPENVSPDSFSFAIDGTTINADSTDPYCLVDDDGACGSFDTTTLTEGEHTLDVSMSYDSTTLEQSLTFTVDNVPNPNNFIVNGVTDGESVSDTITIEATPLPGITATNFRFFIDGNLIRTESRAPYCMAGDNGVVCNPYSTAGLVDGDHELLVEMNWSGPTETIALNFSTGGPPAPSVNIQGLSEGETVSGQLTVSAEALNTVADSITFLVDGQEVTTDVTAPYCLVDNAAACDSYDTSSLDNGAHTLTARMSFSEGTVEETVNFTVDNPLPDFALAGIIEGQNYDETITVEATPENTTATEFSFAIDGTTIATDADAPYCLSESSNTCSSYDVSTLATGQHTLIAIMTYPGGTIEKQVGFTTGVAPVIGNCGLLNEVFCEDFEGPRANGVRTGEFDPAKFSAGRLDGTHYVNEGGPGWVEEGAIGPCNSTSVANPLPTQDTLVCDPTSTIQTRHGLTAVTAQDYGDNSYRINQPFNFDGRTGTIQFDASIYSPSLLHGSTLVSITDSPMAAPSIVAENGNGSPPANGFIIHFNKRCRGSSAQTARPTVRLYTNYAEQEILDANGQDGWCPPSEAVLANSDALNRVELRLSESRLEIWASDASADGVTFGPLKQMFESAPLNLPFSEGWVSFGGHNHATSKYGGYNSFNTVWDNIAFDGPLTTKPDVYQAPNANEPFANGLNLGYTFNNSSNPIEHVIPVSGVDTSGVTAASLVFNAWIQHSSFPDVANREINVRLNGGTWQPVTLPSGAAADAQSRQGTRFNYNVPIDSSELVDGDNTIEFASENFQIGGYPPFVANIDLFVYR